ncbi:MAG: phosphoglucosamine mutase [Solobacterium sp.]|nr:phosphoglucosamine mutase [Solobacterium sp.]MDY2732391.1 phosphoglucosamine mutase [Erysipelotrichaceae bacterium]MCI7731628.1 phosphoglucosamine mutase [Solobacterium sp.]MDD5842693.1 phosphoglucosamine mutase [Solobacterium sp.]MDD5982498.1 phosphoglucosamine mutase [Solobacterium sp.]
MGKYFGTDGFRGEANVNLTADHAYKIGRFLGWYYGEIKRQRGIDSNAKIVIGKDTRRSSYMFEYSLVGGLVASGADAYLLHVTTTPSVAYVARIDDFDCGIMISASHNPYYDNGIKLINNHGEKMDEETIKLVEDYLDGDLNLFDKHWDELPFAHKDKIGCTVDYVSGRNRYIGYLISLGVYSFKGKKVALDCANGSSWNIAKSVFDALGAKTLVINNQPDGFNINTNAGSTHIEGLQRFVVENQCDVGFAYDGDADRCLCVDEKGNVVNGDQILYIYGKYMKQRGKLINNTIVATVMSNFGFFKALDEEGIEYAKTKVGDKYVYEYMVQNGCRIGGEQSGHIIFTKYASTGDGILTSVKMMEAMIAQKKTLSELAAPCVMYPQVLKNVKVKNKADAQNDPDVQKAVKEVADKLGDTGRILVRESGTEPVIRVMVEAKDPQTCEILVNDVVKVIEEKGHAI